MAGWSPEIANEFIRRARRAGHAGLTQMQLQKLVYIAHGWNLAINGSPLTEDEPAAFDYGPVYRMLWQSLRSRGREPIREEIKNGQYAVGTLLGEPDAIGEATLSPAETQVIDRVFQDYGNFHAFQLSALTHQADTPWDRVYNDGRGKNESISQDLIRDHFVQLAHRAA